ncbi:hypothetical protein SR914_24805 [Comamonas testosteroni]|uniref:hypothetical protein n=1 Tax=Comamonas testosteroni TaxID=285 RepID=UPI001237555A|nr:hypothetical protein [Comamonas testosteroni]WQG66336.1 hypothetical protein SR914_24805 [Comamonas testosteroni]
MGTSTPVRTHVSASGKGSAGQSRDHKQIAPSGRPASISSCSPRPPSQPTPLRLRRLPSHPSIAAAACWAPAMAAARRKAVAAVAWGAGFSAGPGILEDTLPPACVAGTLLAT